MNAGNGWWYYYGVLIGAVGAMLGFSFIVFEMTLPDHGAAAAVCEQELPPIR